nr:hypothetical protein BaRGS_004546 [Batillaria attramentaria]
MLNDGYRVTCVISVENWTRFPLVYPDTRIHGGRLSKPPRAILPSSREAMVARKTGLTATGSYGTVSWLIRGLNRRVYVMWDAPFSFDFHENELSVGLSKPGHIDHPSGRTAYDLMYYGGSRDADWMEFRRRTRDKMHLYARKIVPSH